MIRVNLLPGGSGRRRAGLAGVLAAASEQRAALFGVTLLLATALAVTASWWTLDRTRRQLDADIAAGEAEVLRLQESIRLVETATARDRDLRERLGVIERLRATQRAPVTLLDTIGEALPDGLWLLELKQQEATVRVEGRALSLTALTDFVDRLQASRRFVRPLDIVTTSMEPLGDTPVVRFAIRGEWHGGHD